MKTPSINSTNKDLITLKPVQRFHGQFPFSTIPIRLECIRKQKQNCLYIGTEYIFTGMMPTQHTSVTHGPTLRFIVPQVRQAAQMAAMGRYLAWWSRRNFIAIGAGRGVAPQKLKSYAISERIPCAIFTKFSSFVGNVMIG